jgi:hypothetical protein
VGVPPIALWLFVRSAARTPSITTEWRRRWHGLLEGLSRRLQPPEGHQEVLPVLSELGEDYV